MAEESLLSKIKTFFSQYADFSSTQHKIYGNHNALMALGMASNSENIEGIWESLTDEQRLDPKLRAAYDSAKLRVEIDGGKGVFGSLAKSLFEGFGDLGNEIQKKIEAMLTDSLSFGTPGITDSFKDFTEDLLKELFKKMNPNLGDDATAEMNKYVDSMSSIIGLGLTFSVATVLAELIHPTKEMGFGHISHFLYDTIGFNSLMDAYIKPARYAGIEMPVRYNINTLLQTIKPEMRDAINWFGRGHIGDEGFKEFMRWHGIEDKWFGPYKRHAAYHLSYFMLNAIAGAGLYDEEKFKFWLSDAGYGAFPIHEEDLTEYEKTYGLKAPNESQIDFLLGNYARMSAAAEFAGVKSLAKKAYKEGMMTAAEFAEKLKMIGINETVIDLEISLIDLEKQDEKKDLSRSVIEKLYKYGRLTREDAILRLTGLGYTESGAGELIDLVDIQKEEEPKELTRAQLEGMFKRGVIDETLFRAKLINMKYETADIDLMVLDSKRGMKEGAGEEET